MNGLRRWWWRVRERVHVHVDPSRCKQCGLPAVRGSRFCSQSCVEIWESETAW